MQECTCKLPVSSSLPSVSEALRYAGHRLIFQPYPAQKTSQDGHKADKEKSTEKIDGAIATIMGLDRANPVRE